MFGSAGLGEELHALKSELTRLMRTAADDAPGANASGTVADDISSVLNEFGDVIGKEEEHVERLIVERPLVSLASAFALGIAIGFMLRRH